MKRSRIFLFLMFTLILFFSGCQNRTPIPEPPRLVTRVDVDYRHGQETLSRQYTTPEKMSNLLNYIRLVKDCGRPEADPEQTLGDTCKITVHLSDGSRRIYHQRSDRYFSRDLSPWETIDPKQGEQLLPLLEALESDPPRESPN